MQTEFEVRFLDIDHDKLRHKLKKAGAKLIQPKRLMRRRNFDFPDEHLAKEKSAWVRVRDEGGKITMSYKQTDDYTASGTKEVNIDVDDFEAATDFLRAIGMVQKAYQETKRESWLLEQVQIELEEWPWLPTYMEVEGPNVDSLRRTSALLDLDWNLHHGGDATATYMRYYDLTADEIIHTQLVFGAVPKRFADAKRPKRLP